MTENLDKYKTAKDPFLKIELEEITNRIFSGLLGAVAGAGLWGGLIYFMAKEGGAENPMKAAYIAGGIAAVGCGLYSFGGGSWDGEDDEIREEYDNIRKKYIESTKKPTIS